MAPMIERNCRFRRSYQDTDFGFRQNETLGVNFDMRHELSRRLSGYAGVFYRRSESMFDQATCQTSPFLFGFDVTAPLCSIR